MTFGLFIDYNCGILIFQIWQRSEFLATGAEDYSHFVLLDAEVVLDENFAVFVLVQNERETQELSVRLRQCSMLPSILLFLSGV